MIKIKEIFECLSGNNDLTEEFIYKHVGLRENEMYTVLSSSTDETESMGLIPLCKNSKSQDIKVFKDKKGILVARNGKAGTMRYLPEGKYTINDHAYILYLKDSCKAKYKILENEEETFLKYFICAYSTQVKSYATNNDNATWNKTTFFKDFEIDSADVTEETLLRFKSTNKELEQLENIINLLNKEIILLSEKFVSIDPTTQDDPVILGKVFAYCSRNDALSEEGIYYRQPDGNDLTVLSGSTSNLVYGKINKKSEKIHYVENTQCLHLVSRGNAGKLTYLPKGDYATNTNAFLLYLKKEFKKEHNIVLEHQEEMVLKYYLYYLQPTFFEISSKSDLGVFPLTNAISTLYIPVIKYSDEIESIVNTIEQFEELKNNVSTLKERYEAVKEKQLLSV